MIWFVRTFVLPCSGKGTVLDSFPLKRGSTQPLPRAVYRVLGSSDGPQPYLAMLPNPANYETCRRSVQKPLMPRIRQVC